MATQLSYMQRMQVSEKTRQRFVAEAGKAMVELTGIVEDRLSGLMNEAGASREMQSRRDAWTLYQKLRSAWLDGTMRVWEGALKPQAKDTPKKNELSLEDGGLSLVGTDVVENKILASRLVMAVTEKVSSELDDLRVRVKFLESRDELDGHDILRPEVLILLMVEQWSACGMPRDSWPMVNEVVQKHLIDRLKTAYRNANQFLVQQGVMPTIDFKDRVRRAGVNPARARPPGPPPQDPAAADAQYPGDAGGWNPTAYAGDPGGYAGGAYPAPAQPSGYGAMPPSPAGGHGSHAYGGPSGPAPYPPAQGAPAYPGAPAGQWGASAGYPQTAPGYGARTGAPGGAPGGAAVVSAPAPLGGAAVPAPPGAPAPSMPGPRPAGSLFGGRLGWDDGGGAAGGMLSARAGRAPAAAPVGADPGAASNAAPGQTPAQMQQAMAAQGQPSTYGTHEETRLMTQTTPLARTRSRAQGMFGQIKRLFVGQGGGEFGATAAQPPSPALAAAIAERPARESGAAAAGGTIYQDYTPAGVARVAGELREKTDELKKKAETKSEKATIEIVALMFQAILSEDRIPPAIRVWFARLQMPVLRVALAEPEFFGTLNHPARQLIDRMGSCVLGFDASGINGSALEAEIKRIVQVIEQYPETGKRVFQIVYEEFQKFLAKFLTGKEKTQKVVSVAQQVEQKETLTIQYTIELRNLLKDIPVRDEIRTFLFKVWAEVLAVSAVRKGPKDAETVALKKAAADLVWSASAKPNRNDRARVIQDLPQLLQRLRSGMALLGMAQADQDAHIKTVSDTMADAFMSKTQAIPQAQIDAMTQRLANLEDFVSEDGLGDLPLDAESIEMMLGIDASTIDVVTNGGSKPTPAMVAWAQELQPGAWFTLDHNGRVSQVQFVWRSERKHLNLFASSDGHSYLIQAGRLAAYLQAGLLLPQEEETLTVRATRDALTKLEANPERLVG